MIVAINEEESLRNSNPQLIVTEEEGKKVAETYGCLFRTLSKNENTKDFIDTIVHDFTKNILEYRQSRLFMNYCNILAQGDLFAFVEAPNIFEVVITLICKFNNVGLCWRCFCWKNEFHSADSYSELS